MNNIVVIGEGGHSKVIQDIIRCRNEKIVAILDDKYTAMFKQDNVEKGPINLYHSFLDKNYRFVIAIGNNIIRKEIVKILKIEEAQYATLVHPSAIIGSNVKIGSGSVIMAGAIINADTTIGKHAIINSGAVIEHDNMIGDFVHISPNSTLAGGIKVGEGTHIGVGASIIPQISIGEWAIVGAGAAVISNIPSHCTAVGVPAKPIKFHI